MKKDNPPTPLDVESKFLINELFFSKTDLTGNILSGNSVFTRVSEYNKEDLIGKPHNIIRHPDMPKVVFKLLWDYLKAGKAVIAYVKNLSKEGKYYWVLAVVFPVGEEYLSIRIKPSSDYFLLIEDVYKSLLAAEETGGMEESGDLLLKTLQSKGFNDYDSFMIKVLIEELNSRQELLKLENDECADKSEDKLTEQPEYSKEIQVKLTKNLQDIMLFCNNINGIFIRLFKNFESLLKIEEMLKVNSTAILTFSEIISILSLNADIDSYRVGKNGLTLSVVSKDIKKKSEEVELCTASISKFSEDISSEAEQVGLLASTSRLQSDMINFFAAELLDQAQSGCLQMGELREIEENLFLLTNLLTETFTHLGSKLNPLGNKIFEVFTSINLINKIIKDLERANVVGNIEASRIGVQGEKFTITFNEIGSSTTITKEKLGTFNDYLMGIIETIKIINESKIEISRHVDSIKSSIDTLQKIQESQPSSEQLAISA